jgi:plastocyanin
MASPELLDERWHAGLDALADPPLVAPDARERIARRAIVRRRHTRLRRAGVVLAGIAALVGVVALTQRSDRAGVTNEPTTPEPQSVSVTLDGEHLAISPSLVGPGRIRVSFQIYREYGERAVALHLPGEQTIVASHACASCDVTRGSFVADPDAHYDMVATVDGAPVATGAIDVVPTYEPPTGDPVATRELSALPSLKFEPDVIKAPAGIIELRLRAAAAGQHVLSILGQPGFALEVAHAGDVAHGKVDLAPGEYTLYCAVPGHWQAGMQATLVVEGK